MPRGCKGLDGAEDRMALGSLGPWIEIFFFFNCHFPDRAVVLYGIPPEVTAPAQGRIKRLHRSI